MSWETTVVDARCTNHLMLTKKTAVHSQSPDCACLQATEAVWIGKTHLMTKHVIATLVQIQSIAVSQQQLSYQLEL